MKRRLLLLYCLCFLAAFAQAQEKAYDPLLDPAVKIIHEKNDRVGAYLWYPGQLSAHLQEKRWQESQTRSLNVGYPGKFYAPVQQSQFQKEVNLKKPTLMTWKSTGKVDLQVNGKPVNLVEANRFELSAGKSKLIFAVQTDDDVPAIQIALDGKTDTEGWKASLDGSYWNNAETSSVFGRNGKAPLDDPETQVLIPPVSILPLRNAEVSEGKTLIRKNGYVLIDFWHLEVGTVTLKAKGQGTLTAFVGESPEETLNEDTAKFEQRAIEPFILSDEEKSINLPERAVRYLKLVCSGPCELSDIQFQAKVWPVDFHMTFESNDERINALWNASVATLHTSTHGFYLDGIKRDYLPWSMDAVLSTFGGDYVFSDKQVSLNSLSVAMLPLHPDTSDLGIPDYPLHALIGLKQHYLRYGDFETVLAYRDRIEQLLQLYETLQDDRGFISANVGVSWGFVPGWATKRGPDKKGTPTYAQIMLYLNYRIGADFSEKWSDKKTAKHYRKKAEALKKAILAHFWQADKGLFRNGYTREGKLDEGISHHAQYWAILADLFPTDQYDNLFETLPKIAYYKDYVSFEKGYEFMAYAKARRVREMWAFLDEVFGDWLDQGHSRFPENFSYRKSKDEQLVFYSRPYGLSLCHGANGVPGIIAVLQGIAGFSQSEQQPNSYTLQPELMDLQWVNLEFPVKEGKIKLQLKQEGTNRITIPKGCTVTFSYKGQTKTFHRGGEYRL